MSLAEDYQMVGTEPRKLKCKTCRWYLELSPADRAFFDKRVAEDATLGRLYKACRQGGLTVVDSGFRTHVRHHHQELLNDQRATQ